VIAYRVLPRERGVRTGRPGHPLWFPRDLQGSGRHDNPELYGCLYLAEDAVAAVAERLAPFRGSGPLHRSMLTQAGRPLALATLSLGDGARVIDLDDPSVLVRERLRPSRVATGRRQATQADAAALHEAHLDAAALRWWSTLEAGWANLTLFDRASRALALEEARELRLDDPELRAAADFLGLL
jgi:RES domain